MDIKVGAIISYQIPITGGDTPKLTQATVEQIMPASSGAMKYKTENGVIHENYIVSFTNPETENTLGWSDIQVKDTILFTSDSGRLGSGIVTGISFGNRYTKYVTVGGYTRVYPRNFNKIIARYFPPNEAVEQVRDVMQAFMDGAESTGYRQNTNDEMLAVLEGYTNGREVEYIYRDTGTGEFKTVHNKDHDFNFCHYFYRLKKQAPYEVVIYVQKNGIPQWAYAPSIKPVNPEFRERAIARWEHRVKHSGYKKYTTTITPE